MPVQTTVQMRRDTAANWTSTNPTLASGEWGLETDTGMTKIGDGTTAWNSLAYEFAPFSDEVIATNPNGAYFDGNALQLYGTGANYASTPDSAALDITGDIDLRAKVALTPWINTSRTQYFVSKTSTGGQYSYEFLYHTNNTFRFRYTTNGSTFVTIASAAVNATQFPSGSIKWVRVTFDADNGASGNTTTFYYSDDGNTWTQIGSPVVNSGVVTIFSGTSALDIGASEVRTVATNATIYRAQVLNGIGGTTAFDANFETVPADSFAFTESSTNAATVTLTTTRYSFGLPAVNLLGTVTFALIQNSTYYNYFRVAGKPITVKHIAFESTVAPATNATVRIAIYASDAMMQPTGAPIYDTGAITVSSAAAAIYRIRVTPFTLLPGNYLIAFNTSVAFTIRGFSNITWSSNTLGAQLVVFRRVGQTLSGGYPNPGLKWNTIGGASSSTYNFAVLGWS